MMKSLLLSVMQIATCLLLSTLTAQAADDAIHLEVSSGNHAREQCVIRYKIPENFGHNHRLSLIRSADGKRIPVQIDGTKKERTVFWILQKELHPHRTRKYKLQIVKEADPGVTKTNPAVTLKNDGKKINIKVGSKQVLAYRHATVKSPFPDKPYYARSGYIHPLYTPSGKEITDDFNPDHAHQHGIMFAWRKILFDGRHNNAWDQIAMLGRVEHAQIETMTDGDVFGDLIVRLHHVDLTSKNGPVTMLDETMQIRVYALSDHFLFDICSTQSCATEHPVIIEKIHYGGMTIRGHANWHKTRAYDFLTSDAMTKKDGNHSRPNWVEMHGPLNGESVGVTIMDHPGNFRFPQPVRLHPTMPYFCFTPAQLGEFRIEPDKPFVSKYRYYVHSGKPNAEISNRLWKNYALPMQVKVIKN